MQALEESATNLVVEILVGLCALPVLLTFKFEDLKMSKSRDRIVYKRPDGQWANKMNGAGKASSVHNTQSAAIKAARGMLKNQGGGELTTVGLDHKIRDKDTVAPGHDPYPPKG